jgi:hypothetical protein
LIASTWTPRNPFSPPVVDDLRQRQCHHREVDPTGAQRQEPDHQADQARGGDAGADRGPPGPATQDDRDPAQVAADAQECGMAEGQHAGVAEQEVEADREQAEQQDVQGECFVGQDERQHQQQGQHHQNPVPAGKEIGTAHHGCP